MFLLLGWPKAYFQAVLLLVLEKVWVLIRFHQSVDMDAQDGHVLAILRLCPFWDGQVTRSKVNRDLQIGDRVWSQVESLG